MLHSVIHGSVINPEAAAVDVLMRVVIVEGSLGVIESIFARTEFQVVQTNPMGHSSGVPVRSETRSTRCRSAWKATLMLCRNLRCKGHAGHCAPGTSTGQVEATPGVAR